MKDLVLEGLRPLFSFDQSFFHQAAVELLDVRVHTLPVRLLHPHQVFGIQQRGAAYQPSVDREWRTAMAMSQP